MDTHLAPAHKLAPEMTRLRRELHRHPEPGRQETPTAGVVADSLGRLGLKVRCPVDAMFTPHLFSSYREGRIIVKPGADTSSTAGLRLPMIGKGGHVACPHRAVTDFPNQD